MMPGWKYPWRSRTLQDRHTSTAGSCEKACLQELWGQRRVVWAEETVDPRALQVAELSLFHTHVVFGVRESQLTHWGIEHVFHF